MGETPRLQENDSVYAVPTQLPQPPQPQVDDQVNQGDQGDQTRSTGSLVNLGGDSQIRQRDSGSHPLSENFVDEPIGGPIGAPIGPPIGAPIGEEVEDDTVGPCICLSGFIAWVLTIFLLMSCSMGSWEIVTWMVPSGMMTWYLGSFYMFGGLLCQPWDPIQYTMCLGLLPPDTTEHFAFSYYEDWVCRKPSVIGDYSVQPVSCTGMVKLKKYAYAGGGIVMCGCLCVLIGTMILSCRRARKAVLYVDRLRCRASYMWWGVGIVLMLIGFGVYVGGVSNNIYDIYNIGQNRTFVAAPLLVALGPGAKGMLWICVIAVILMCLQEVCAQAEARRQMGRGTPRMRKNPPETVALNVGAVGGVGATNGAGGVGVDRTSVGSDATTNSRRVIPASNVMGLGTPYHDD